MKKENKTLDNILKKDIASTIIYYFKSLSKPEMEIQNLLLENKDKVKCVINLDRLDYGIEINEELKELIIKSPEENKKFNEIHKKEKVEWMISNCEFVPIKIS